MKINIIVATDLRNGIGLSGNLPWNIKEDLSRFMKLTVGAGNNCVLMGRKTYESLPKKASPLKKRHNIVLSRNPPKEKLDPSVSYITNINDALNVGEYDEMWVIGGSEMYALALEQLKIDTIYITRILRNYNCDRFFPMELVKKTRTCVTSDIIKRNDVAFLYVDFKIS